MSVIASQEDVQSIWRSADAVCFDVDSTVLEDEGLDELAEFCGVGLEVREWTKRAMGGNVSFREALTARLKIVNPSHQKITEFIKHHDVRFTPGIKELVAKLQSRGTEVYLVSGGFHSIIEPAAKGLNIPTQNIFANKLKFYYKGEFAGFDENQPTSDSGGKGLVVKQLKERFGYKKLVFVGDGVTDMEACPPADAFIGFGGNVIRSSVKEKAAWFVMSFQELISELDKAS
ncbi:hypothetical protein ACJMK2_015794 [Sinanodonta woodiana]|uniref:Phosphoserine phosphatase n=1 Tax=Sinanodonta woodiana TaxID=1069815 RepID=A0ABD3URI8_SINWO